MSKHTKKKLLRGKWAASPWKPIRTAPRKPRVEVDLWMHIWASPLSMGMSDSFRVTDAYRKDDGKWYHRHEGKEKELTDHYITHWMRIPKAPKP